MAARVIDLTFLTSAQGFIIQGDLSGNRAGWSVSNAGDVNRDGIADVIVGASYGDNGKSNAGAAYVVCGKASGFGTLDLAALGSGEGIVIVGDEADDLAGQTIAGAGDGIDDFVVGSPHPVLGNGAADFVFRRTGGYTVSDIIPLAASNGFRAIGEAGDDWAGYAVPAADDVNHDGIDDLIVESPINDEYTTNSGKDHFIYGQRVSSEVTLTGTDIGQRILGGRLDDILNGLGGEDDLQGGGWGRHARRWG
ncbi:integrin alpha [Maritimibacter alexandrii]|uniref:integrin alpha n=1 Tax=Maritimibacter alexandrii TaxID=2570355 RepID=UPI00110882A7|nr:integrin alpha [Maritimibacter alexandrii]